MNPTPMRTRQAAYTTTARALHRKEIVKPDACTACGRKTTVYGHHPNYEEPLNIEWLCGSCHKKAHIIAGDVIHWRTNDVIGLKNEAKKERQQQIHFPKGNLNAI